MMEEDYIEFEYDNVLVETDSAYRFLYEDKKKVWIPKSVIKFDDHPKETNSISVAEWFAFKEGLI